MRDLIKTLVREELLTEGDLTHRLTPHLTDDMPDIFSFEYRTKVLGLKSSINENIDLEERRLIIEAFTNMKAWFEKVKSLPKDIGDIMSVLQQVIGNPTVITKWVKALEASTVIEGVRDITNFLSNISKASMKIGFTKIHRSVTTLMNKFNDGVLMLKSKSGWQKAIGYTILALIVRYILDKVGKVLFTPLVEMGKEFLSNVDIGKGLTDLGGFMLKIFVGAGAVFMGDVMTFIEWGKTAFKTVAFLVRTLIKPARLFKSSSGSWILWKTDKEGVLKEIDDINETLIKTLLREGLNKKRYLGQCDLIRGKSEENERRWHVMMSNKKRISFNEFVNSVDYGAILDEDEDIKTYLKDTIRSDGSTAAYKSVWGDRESIFLQTAGFEFIFV